MNELLPLSSPINICCRLNIHHDAVCLMHQFILNKVQGPYNLFGYSSKHCVLELVKVNRVCLAAKGTVNVRRATHLMYLQCTCISSMSVTF